MTSEAPCCLCGAASICFTRVRGSDWNKPVCDACLHTVNAIIERGMEDPQTTQTIDLFIWATLTCIFITLLAVAVLMMS